MQKGDETEVYRLPHGKSENEEHESANEAHGILANVCDALFGDEERALNHGYEGVFEKIKELCAAEKKARENGLDAQEYLHHLKEAQSECERLRAEVERLRGERDESERKRAEISEQWVLLRAELDEAQRHWDKADRDRRAAESESAGLRADRDHYRAEYESINTHIGSQLAASRAESAGLREENEHLMEMTKQMQALTGREGEKVDQARAIMDIAVAERDALRARLEGVRDTGKALDDLVVNALLELNDVPTHELQPLVDKLERALAEPTTEKE